MLMVVFIVGLLSYGIALAISRTTLSRLSLLAQTMHAVEQGDVTARITPVGKDEIGQLMGSFSRMMERIDGLLEEKVAYGREIKKSGAESPAGSDQSSFSVQFPGSYQLHGYCTQCTGNHTPGQCSGPFLQAITQQGEGSDFPGR